MADRIGDDLLRTAQQHLRALGIVDAEARRQLEMDREARHAFGQALQRLRQIDAVLVAKLAHDLAHVAEQELGDRLRLVHVILRLPADEMARDFEIQAERRQVMADQIVQLARDAHALGEPARFGEQRARRAKLGVQPSLILARLGLLLGDDRW